MKESYRIEVYNKNFIPVGHAISSIDWMLEGAFYQIQGGSLVEGKLKTIAMEVFSNPVTQKVFYKDFDAKQLVELISMEGKTPDYVVEISYRAGVTDNTGRVASEAISLFFPKYSIECFSGRIFFIKSFNLTEEKVREIIVSFYANQLIEEVRVESYEDFLSKKRFCNIAERKITLQNDRSYEVYPFDCSLDKLENLSQEKCWALRRDELKVIQDHYLDEKPKKQREKWGLPSFPTDVEIEILAQTWSEHCKHKIFSSRINYSESNLPKNFKRLGDFIVNSLYRSRIQGATKKVKEKRGIDWTISVFSDNAGIVRYSDKIDLAIKVETHNSPSALDPYGGALTGILGVNRDILGVGLGARPICNTNVLCFAPFNWPMESQRDELPRNLFHPRQVLEGVHRGIKDGGE